MKYRIKKVSLILVLIILLNGCNRGSIDNTLSDNTASDNTASDNTASDNTVSDNILEKRMIILKDNKQINIDIIFENTMLESLNSHDLSLLRNSIYAKYGYMFSKKEYEEFFLQYNWYSPSKANVEHLLNESDKKNINSIRALEKKMVISYVNKNLGFSMEFPASWKGKYVINETKKGIIVKFKHEEKFEVPGGEFFSIINIEHMEKNEENEYDSVGGKKIFSTTKAKYFIGGPTDFAFPENHPETEKFLQMQREIERIIDSIKVLND